MVSAITLLGTASFSVVYCWSGNAFSSFALQLYLVPYWMLLVFDQTKMRMPDLACSSMAAQQGSEWMITSRCNGGGYTEQTEECVGKHVE